MKKANLICVVYLVCIFLPYSGAFQYVSHLILFGLVLFFNTYYRLVPIILVYGYGIIVFAIQLIALKSDVFLSGYLLSLFYAPLFVILLPNANLLKEVNYDLEKIIKIVFSLYSILLWYQALANWWNPESVGGVHGIIKGPHLNAQLFLLLSGYFLFKDGKKIKLVSFWFLLTAIICDYNLGTLVFFISIFLTILGNLSLQRKHLKYIALIGILIVTGFFILVKVSEERAYLFDMLLALSSDYTYSGKIGYNINFFSTFFHQNSFDFLFGISPGNGGSRSALILTGNFIKFKIPAYLISEPGYVVEYVYPYLYGVSNIARGTINQPFSSLIALFSEYGLFIATAMIIYWRKFLASLKNRSQFSHSFLIANFSIWLVISHSLEFLPFVVLFQLLIFSNCKK